MALEIKPFEHPPQPQTFSSFASVTSYARRLWGSLYQARKGKIECTVLLTLTANAASTTLTDTRLSNQSCLSFDPLTANAAAELAAGTLYALEANRATGSVVLTHANSAQTDRKFIVSMVG